MHSKRLLETSMTMNLIVLLLVHAVSFAADISSAEDLRLENIRYEIMDTDQPGVKKYIMEADFKGTREQVCGVICDYYHLNTYMPREVGTRVVKQQANQITLDVTLDIPWPFQDLKSILLIDYEKDKGKARWKLIGGNIKQNDGTIEVEQHGEYSHVRQTTYIDIGRNYPDWFIVIYTRSLTYKVMRAIKAQIETRSAGINKGPEAVPPVEP